jgi:TonB family protein
MATRPLPEAAAGSRFAVYVDELHEFLATNRMPFGSPDDLAPVIERLREPGPFPDDLSSLVRSFILRQGGAMPHAQLLEILTLAIAGPEVVDNPQRYGEPIRQLLGFVAGIMRRPWNVPPGEIVPFPGAESSTELAARKQPEIIAEPDTPAPPIPAPIHPTPASIPPPQSTPEPSPPPSAIAAALVESKLMSQLPEFAPKPETPQPEPVIFLRAAASEPAVDSDAEPNRRTSIFRNILAATAGTAALATIAFLVYNARKPAENASVQPIAANSQPAAIQPPSPQTQSAAQPFYTGISHPPKPSAEPAPVDSVPDRQPQPLNWIYPEPNPPESTAEVVTPEPTTSAQPESPAPAEIARQPAKPQTTASNDYVPYSPSAADSGYAPYNNATPAPPAPIVRRSADSRIVGDPVVTEHRSADDTSVAGPIPVPPPHSSSSYFYNVASGVMTARLIFNPRPEYPVFARLTHVQGPVMLQAVIDKDGTVSSARVVRGPHMLRGAAEDAVRRWRYLPYRINGRPVDVATTITVDFHEGSASTASALH